MSKILKVQKSIHIPKDLHETIKSRLVLTKRTYSAEIEYMLEKLLSFEDKANRAAVKLSEGCEK